jgi:hypothetical protein
MPTFLENNDSRCLAAETHSEGVFRSGEVCMYIIQGRENRC